jgi:hypothetical protein
MPAAIDPVIKKQVINQWLSGASRDKIAADNGIGAGTVSNIIDEWKKGVQDSAYESSLESLIVNLASYLDRDLAKVIEAAAQISESAYRLEN